MEIQVRVNLSYSAAHKFSKFRTGAHTNLCSSSPTTYKLQMTVRLVLCVGCRFVFSASHFVDPVNDKRVGGFSDQ